MKSTKHKHMSLSDRIQIEAALNQGMLLKDISALISKDPTTVSKEIKRRRFEKLPSTYGRSRDYLDLLPACSILDRFPFTCNHCSRKAACRLIKYYYRAQDAHKAYLYDLSDSRQGYDISLESLRTMDQLLTPLIKQGQSLYHIKINNPSDIPVSLNTLYNYTNDGLLSFTNIDLPRKVRYKPRKKNPVAKLPKEAKSGRLYRDFLAYIADNDILDPVQVDTVEGRKSDKKCLLTLLFVRQRFMIIRLLPKQSALYVKRTFDGFESKLGFDSFRLLFNVCLGDNGSEFSDLIGMQTSPFSQQKRMNLFYCDPLRSDQKGALEKNHEFIRMILPKGTSFEFLTNKKVKLIETNINSYARKSLQNKTPYECFVFSYGADVCRALSLLSVPANNVTLNPSLVR